MRLRAQTLRTINVTKRIHTQKNKHHEITKLPHSPPIYPTEIYHALNSEAFGSGVLATWGTVGIIVNRFVDHQGQDSESTGHKLLCESVRRIVIHRSLSTELIATD
mmetsp:Transcript_6806/g.12040  ORF Transcript_6806/g.12040 Transcript_6806/m.12040 type:complete len:106 (-) Transcript_6806:1581-1898(-)